MQPFTNENSSDDENNRSSKTKKNPMKTTKNPMKQSVIDPIPDEVPGYWSAVFLKNESF